MGNRTLLQEQVILREEGVQENLSQQPMRMVDCESRASQCLFVSDSDTAFIPVFKCNHPTVRVPNDIKFRLRLIKFTSLYSKRHIPCEITPPAQELESVRRKHRKRAEEFYDSSSDSSFQGSLFEQQMGNYARRQAASSKNNEETVSLADLVPMFIGLSAARASLLDDEQVGVHEGWMELAGEFMLQAALEQCLEYSDCSGTKLREIFSWGWRPNPTKFWEDEEAANDMFCDDDVMEEIQSWSVIRQKYIDLVRLLYLSSNLPADHLIAQAKVECRSGQAAQSSDPALSSRSLRRTSPTIPGGHAAVSRSPYARPA
jgi:hypothetical protein